MPAEHVTRRADLNDESLAIRPGTIMPGISRLNWHVIAGICDLQQEREQSGCDRESHNSPPSTYA
jgi:hypothetical protein